MVETLAAEGAHDPLADRVRVGGLDRRPETLDADSGRPGGEVGAVDTVAVVDQESGLSAPGGGFDQLAPNPGCGRVRGYLEVEQLTAAVADEEQDIKGAQAERLNHEQVGRPDGMGLIGQEGALALAGRARASPPAVAPNGAGADRDSQLEELAADAFGAPERVLLGHG